MLVELLVRLSWRRDAACVGKGELFFSDDEDDQDAAVILCQACPARLPCLAETFLFEADADYLDGVRGGLRARERRQQ